VASVHRRFDAVFTTFTLQSVRTCSGSSLFVFRNDDAVNDISISATDVSASERTKHLLVFITDAHLLTISARCYCRVRSTVIKTSQWLCDDWLALRLWSAYGSRLASRRSSRRTVGGL